MIYKLHDIERIAGRLLCNDFYAKLDEIAESEGRVLKAGTEIYEELNRDIWKIL